MQDCKLCSHRRVCELWNENECQNAWTLSSTDDKCDFFTEEHRWIPVTERLPQENMPLGAKCETVQVLLDDGSVTVGYCNRGKKLWVYLPDPITNFVIGSTFEKSPVKAWKPLSDPPKDNRQGKGTRRGGERG